jgi:anti-sigma B factor antagonist
MKINAPKETKPARKKPKPDAGAEAKKLVSGGAQKRASASKKTNAHKEPSRSHKSGQEGNSASGLKVKESNNGYCTILADGNMNIYVAARQKSILLDALQRHQHIKVDLSKVEEMDTAGLQLLLLLKHTASQTGKDVALSAHSPATLEVINRYKLAGYFGDSVIMAPTGR